jgi:hypothetical protein
MEETSMPLRIYSSMLVPPVMRPACAFEVGSDFVFIKLAMVEISKIAPITMSPTLVGILGIE